MRGNPPTLNIEFTEDREGRWEKIFDILEEHFRSQNMGDPTIGLEHGARKERGASTSHDRRSMIQKVPDRRA